MKVVAIIPARGSSQRIPKKALQILGDKSLIAHSISKLKASKFIQTSIVSTDSVEIANEAIKYGIPVPFLRQNFSDSISPVSLASVSTVKQYTKEYNLCEDDLIVQIMPNCPFIETTSIDKFVEYFLNQPESTSLLSCVRVDPITRFIFEQDEKQHARFKLITLDEINKRTQDFLPLFTPSGAIWITTLKNLLTFETFYVPGFEFREISFLEGFDIDTQDQLEFARKIFSH